MKKISFLIFIFFISCSTAPSPKIEQKSLTNPLNIPLFNEFSTYFANEFAQEYLRNSRVFTSENEIEILYASDRGCIISLQNDGTFRGSSSVDGIRTAKKYMKGIDGSLSNSLLLKKDRFQEAKDYQKVRSSISHRNNVDQFLKLKESIGYGSTHPDASIPISLFCKDRLFYDFDNLREFLSNSYIIEPKSFLDKKLELESEFDELSSMFQNYLNDKNKDFFKPYKKTEFVKTGEDYNTDTYDMYRSANVDPLLAMSFSKVSTGYNKETEVMRTAYITHSETIEPSWDEIKEHFGGLQGLMDRGITKETSVKLSYVANIIEFSYENESNRIIAALHISLNPSSLGKEFYSDLLKNGNKIKIIGEAKMKENYFHISDYRDGDMKYGKVRMIEQPLIFECTFPENPTNKTKFEVPLKLIGDNNIYKDDLKKLKTLFTDEAELLFNKVPYTRYFKEHNRVVVFFSSDE